MAVLTRMQWAGVTPQDYDEACHVVNWEGRPPVGNVFHLAWFADGGLNVVDVWDFPEDFEDFEVFRMRVLEGQAGKAVGEAVGVSEATVSRRLARVRDRLRERLAEVVGRFSFTAEEREEALRNGLDPNPNKSSDALFDEAVAEVYHRYLEFRGEP